MVAIFRDAVDTQGLRIHSDWMISLHQLIQTVLYVKRRRRRETYSTQLGLTMFSFYILVKCQIIFGMYVENQWGKNRKRMRLRFPAYDSELVHF